MGSILDDEGPAHDLDADIEKLRDHSLAVTRNGENAPERRKEVDVVRLIVVCRHLCELDQEEQGDDDEPDDQIRLDQNREVRIPDCREFGICELCAPGGVERIHLRLNEMHRHIHADQ